MVGTQDFEKVSLEMPLGSGAYKVEGVDSAARSPTAAPDWSAKDLWMNKGRNNYDAIRYDYYRDDRV